MLMRFVEVMAGWWITVGIVIYLTGRIAGTWRLNREHRRKVGR